MFYLLLLAMVLLMAPGGCNAGGILHVFPPTHEGESFAVARPQVLLSKTWITVSETQIEYRMDQTFFNDNEFPLKGVFLFPIETDADFSSVEARVNGTNEDVSFSAPGDFFSTLRKFTEDMKDPALLGLAGRPIVQMSPFTIGARQQIAFRLHYKRPLLPDKNGMELVVPLDGERYALAPVGEFEVAVRFKMSRRVAGIFSPSHHISTVREAPHRCLVSAKTQQKKIREDFHLIATFPSDDLDFQVFTRRLPQRSGTFMVMMVPPVSMPESKDTARDVVFVLEVSGAMGADEFEFAKRVILEAVTRLGPQDRFNIVATGTRVRKMAKRLTAVTKETIDKAAHYLDLLPRSGGTDVYNALLDSLDQFTTVKRSCFVMFVGRGRATVGITKPEAILEATRHDNKARARILALGLGEQADIALLDKLATANRGGFFHARDSAAANALTEEFLSRVSLPLVADISLSFQDFSPEAMDPNPIPDLFTPEGRAVLGRYRGENDIDTRVRLRGKVHGRPKVLTHSVKFPLEDRSCPYLPGLWAMRQTAKLLEQDRLRGPELGARDEIKKLAQEFGFRVPTTLVDAQPRTASSEREFSALLWLFKTSNVLSDVMAEGVACVGEKVFRFGKTGWVDSEYQGLLPARTVRFLSDEYFSLVRDESRLGPYFAMGPELTVVWGTTALRIKDLRGVP